MRLISFNGNVLNNNRITQTENTTIDAVVNFFKCCTVKNIILFNVIGYSSSFYKCGARIAF